MQNSSRPVTRPASEGFDARGCVDKHAGFTMQNSSRPVTEGLDARECVDKPTVLTIQNSSKPVTSYMLFVVGGWW